MLSLKATNAQLTDKARILWKRVQSENQRAIADKPPKIDKGILTRYREHFDRRVGDLALSLSTKEMTVNQWQRAMRDEIEKLHLTSWIVGRGGLDGLSAVDLKAVRRKVGEQAKYLDNFAQDLRGQRNRREDFDPAKIANRARLYGGAASATVNQANTAAIGLPRLPQYPGDGSTLCRVSCRCSLRIDKLKGQGDWNIYWKLGKAEHCEDCIELSKRWNPLRIRKGVLL